MRHELVRTLGVVLLMLVGGALACSVTVSTARFENAAVVTDPQAESRARSFRPSDTVYVIADVADVDGEAAIRAIWSRLTLDEQSRVVEAAEVDRDEITSADGRVAFEMTPPDPEQQAWPPGTYRVELYLDGDRGTTIDFPIR